ncbi:DUF7619 domain-containing protein [Lacibacter sediminis]|uniref:T9SS type A sorting domain-containing protein n=1 Tax=Lacibacter sediminis TaxID=2760713 RepID=A0A7G5XCS9_9BACT|nr:T9SS type A sorting domain-containing protein [Lacibacter sediminis]QNA43282.1 T9SS type A sorting domain-containing protein [Lacibacter sediminis]
MGENELLLVGRHAYVDVERLHQSTLFPAGAFGLINVIPVDRLGAVTLHKFDKNRKLQWKRKFGDDWYSHTVDVSEVIQTKDGGIVCLIVTPTIKFGFDQPVYSGDNIFFGDVYLCKYDTNGNLVWEKYFGGNRWDFAYTLNEDRYGNILIAGHTWSASDNFAGIRLSVDTSAAAYKMHGVLITPDSVTNVDTVLRKQLYEQYRAMNDAFIAKFSASGQLIKAKCFGGSGSDKLVHLKDHPTYGYVAIGFSDSKDMDLPATGAKGGLWMLHLDTGLNIVQNKLLDSGFVGKSIFFEKDNRLFLTDSVKFRELNYNGMVIREHNSGAVLFNYFGYFDKSGFIYQPQGNAGIALYDSTLQPKGVMKIPGWIYGYHAVQGNNRSDLFLIGNKGKFEYYTGTTDPDWNVYSKAVMSFADQFNFIKGKVYVDNNKNNLFDVGEPFLNGIKIEAQKQNNLFTVTTDTEGRFNLPLDTGSYNIKVTSPLPYYNIVPTAANVQFTTFGESDSADFALQPIPNKKDLSINLLPLNIARPGFPVQYQLICTNQGTETISNAQVKFLKNPRVNFVSSSPVVNTTVGDTLIWNITSLSPFDTSYINLNLRIAAPPAVNNTDTLLFKSFAYPIIADETPEDNQFNLVQQVQGSYDPNDKTETHGGIITPEQLAGNDYLTYLIRFQNTGTDTAFNVMIRDTLTNKLDWGSFEMLSSSHPYQLYMIKPHILEWSFPNILLVDSNKNEPASHGFIAYRIKPKSNLSVGDTVLNRAHIYFDYNLPVITNDELTVLRNTVITSVVDLNRPDNQLFLYPNPSNGLITIAKKERMAGDAIIYITDMDGRLVHQTDLGRIAVDQFSQSIDISDLSRGVYVVKLQVGKTSFTTKFILQ